MDADTDTDTDKDMDADSKQPSLTSPVLQKVCNTDHLIISSCLQPV